MTLAPTLSRASQAVSEPHADRVTASVPASAPTPTSVSSTASRRKEPRRTAERILEVTLALFNRFGEPNVSTTLISSELHISPGNLYYHYPSKDVLVNALYGRYQGEMMRLLVAARGVTHVEDAWFLFHALFERIWEYRFIYRDLNDLLSRNRTIEMQFQQVLRQKQTAMRQVLQGLADNAGLLLDPQDAEPVATAMVVVLTHWLSFEYERDPRHALEPGEGAAALMRGAYHVLSLLAPYLGPDEKAYLRQLSRSYLSVPTVAVTATDDD